MNVFSRWIVTSAFAVSASAADYEQLTLRDGRTLTGHYDEAHQLLVMDNPHAEMRIDPRDIEKRQVVDQPAEPAPEPAKKAKPTRADDLDELEAFDAKISDLNARAAAINHEATALRVEFYRKWLLAANLDPAVMPKLGDDPTVSQVKRQDELTQLNRSLVDLASMKQRLSRPAYDFARTEEYQVVETFVHSKAYATYLETRGAGQHQAPAPSPAPEREPKPTPLPKSKR